MIYNLNDYDYYNTVSIEYQLSQNIKSLLEDITSKVSSPSYNRTPTFKRNDKNNYRNKKNNEEQWNYARNFTVTKKIEVEGVEVVLNDVRGELNKLVDKNYDVQKGKIIDLLHKLFNEEKFNDNEKGKVCMFIFDVASSNKFYSELYATLYKEISQEVPGMMDIFMKSLDSFMTLFETIESCDPSKDYTLFCEITKKNDERKSLATFIGHLINKDVISSSYLINIVKKIINLFNEYIHEENKLLELQELGEILYIFVEVSKVILTQSEEWDFILTHIKEISTIEIKKFKSMNFKIKFKHMDLLDLIK